MPRGVRVMSDAERELRRAMREFLKRGGRTYATAQSVKIAIDEVLDEARQDAIAAFEPPPAVEGYEAREEGEETPRYSRRRRSA